MNRLTAMLGAALLACLVGPAQARDDKLLLSIDEALNTAAAKEHLTTDVKFYFGGQAHPPVEQKMGSAVTNKKTNAFNKTDKHACEWVFLAAMQQMQQRAKQLGADAVIGIHSYYKQVPFKSDTEYECHAGGIVAGVALRGEFVKLAK